MITVGDVLGELTSVVTLRISILRTKPSTYTEIKDKLLKLLILQSHAALRSSGCPLDEVSTQGVMELYSLSSMGLLLSLFFGFIGIVGKGRKAMVLGCRTELRKHSLVMTIKEGRQRPAS